MSIVWVADAGPLIVLAKIDQLDLLTRMADELLIPSMVAREIRRGLPSDPARLALAAGFGTPMPRIYIPAAVRRLGLLGPGESAALSLALKQGGCTLLVDDKKGRQAADALGIPKIGTLGVLIRARQEGHVTAIVPTLHGLLAAGYYLDQTTLKGAAIRVGEVWP